jgi:hypothetical protein
MLRIRRREELTLGACVPAVDRADRVDHALDLQLPGVRRDRVADGAAADRQTGVEQRRSRGAMDRSVDAAPPPGLVASGEQRVGRGDDRVDVLAQDVRADDLDRAARDVSAHAARS